MQKCCVSLLAWQSNKAILFYFTQNSSPGIWFCTRVQRGWAFSNNLTSLIDLRIVDFSVCSAFLFVGMEWWLLRPIHAGLEAWSIAPFSLVKLSTYQIISDWRTNSFTWRWRENGAGCCSDGPQRYSSPEPTGPVFASSSSHLLQPCTRCLPSYFLP